ncbi:UDP-glucose dehydrogenase family protein [Cohnella faecalis]|uniref:UDP-glucose 6-dehydrogenase n=1 Tax=Cohnella faecalis TaxID=2315694 RepID=A0A398CMU7_9BACL|nr:UDP-glucose/GDP-mannose dehydrogenase family protein [Cohnella faecalis]RIE03795.1 UDP-glucose/GDP-mannose dehydrogenase family protein [Cohnella faecalis]
MNVTVIGTGYVGLTTGVSLAFIGHSVTCVDIDERKIENLLAGVMPIHEHGLESLFEAVRPRLHFTVSYAEAVRNAEVVILAIGTPAREDGSPNLSYLHEAVDQVLGSLAGKLTPTLLVNKSTVPVGTGDRLAEKVAARGLSARVSVASNPEFLRQGRALSDTLYPERIVVGGKPEGWRTLRELYLPLLEQKFEEPFDLPRPRGLAPVKFITVTLRSAELGKYAANAYLAMKISFINEMANLCDRVGADVIDIAGIIGTDTRIGGAFLQAGIGYGGSCFPKDTRALHYIADANGYDFKLLSAVIEVNRSQKFTLIDKLRSELIDFRGRKIAVLGLTFKPGTDDLRETPSLPIVEALLAEGAVVAVHDPVALDKARSLLPASVQASSDLEETLQDAEAALLVTEWPIYLALDGHRLRELMKRPLFIDGRNALPPERRIHLDYRGIGTGAAEAALIT